MDYKEKLTLAKEALDSGSYDKETIEYIFPELKESEDERIREELIDFLKHTEGQTIPLQKYNAWIAWLEKQKDTLKDNLKDIEQKPALVIPKFKVGDKIISTISNIPYYITEVCNGHYLTDVGCIIMFNAQNNFELSNQKPAWSEEDEKIFRALSNTLARISANTRTDSTSINYSFFAEIDWLKSLKERYTWKPSDEQMEALDIAIDEIRSMKTAAGDEVANALSSLYEQLKAMKGE